MGQAPPSRPPADVEHDSFDANVRELMFNGRALPEEIVLLIFSFCDLRSLLQIGAVSRRLRKISSDETIWKPIFKERMGWCKMREHHSSAFNWRQQFVDRRHFCYEKRARNLESSSQDSVTTILWRTLNALNPFSPIRKRKVVFVGLEAAGKVQPPGPSLSI